MATNKQNTAEPKLNTYRDRTRRARLFRPVRRALRRRDADAADPGPRGGLRGRPRPTRLPAPSSTSLNAHYAGRPSPLYFAERLTEALSAAPRSTSSATSSTTPAATRSTTASARSCSPSAWARRASSPRPAPASTAWPRPPCAPASACPARSSWAPTTSSARSPTSFRMKLLGAKVNAGDTSAPARSRTP